MQHPTMIGRTVSTLDLQGRRQLSHLSVSPSGQIQVFVVGRWTSGKDDGTYDNLGFGSLNNLLTGDGERNHIQARAIGPKGWLYVNGTQVAQVPLSAATHSGYLGIFTGFIRDSKREGYVTRYENFHGQALD